MASGIDLCLHLVRRDHGSDVANRVARRCVVPPWREGGQAQFIERPVPEETGTTTTEAREWALTVLSRPVTLDELAQHARMSVRTFTRRFQAEMGTTPGRWLTRQRIEHARRLLETTDLAMDRIAAEAGLRHGGFAAAASGRRRSGRRRARTARRSARLQPDADGRAGR